NLALIYDDGAAIGCQSYEPGNWTDGGSYDGRFVLTGAKRLRETFASRGVSSTIGGITFRCHCASPGTLRLVFRVNGVDVHTQDIVVSEADSALDNPYPDEEAL